jgi:hypothetical protein
MSKSDAYQVAAERTKQTKLVHIVRQVSEGSDMYFVLMTGLSSVAYQEAPLA